MARRRPRLLLAAAAAALALPLTAVGAGPEPAAAAPGPAGLTQEERAAMVAERSRFFGAENVDQRTGALPRDEVHLVWVSVATFAAALDGHVVLFDAYIHKEEDDRRNYVPAVTEDLIALRPEAVLLGHAHYDHGLRAAPIAAATGATIVGTQAHCDQASAQAGKPLACEVPFAPDAEPGTVADVDVAPGVCGTAVLHLHSAAEPPDPSRDPTNGAVGIPDPSAILQHPPGPSTTLVAPGDEGGTLLYQLRIGDFTLVMHDSSGPLKEQAPEVFDVFRSLPETDVHVGALVSFNNFTNGLRDAAMYIDAFDAQVFIPNHHDFVGGEYGGADDYQAVLERELEPYDADPEIRFLADPVDYVRPNLLRFDVTDARWADAGGTPCARAAGAGTASPAGAVDASVEAATSSRASGKGLAATGPLPAAGAAVLLVGAALALRRRSAARAQPGGGS